MRKDGSRFFVDGLLLALKDPGTRETRGFAKICRDASEHHEASEALRRAHAELEQRVADRTTELAQINAALKREIERREELEREILAVTDRERGRISQDLHDVLCQELSATAILLKSRAKNIGADNPKCAESLEVAAQTVNRTVGLARDLAHNLRPFDFLPGGLISALRQLAARTNKRIPCRCDCSQRIYVRDRNISVNLYRIAQEAVNNSLKHAETSHVVIGLRRCDNALVLYIRDDGAGFQLSKKRRGLGIHLMTHRASVVNGKLSIDTQPGRGTTITCQVPLRRSRDSVRGLLGK
jgi:signal transduction histidine kinase